MPSLTIPSPSGATFTVEIKDADGDVVYSGTQTNTPFDPEITDPGDYTVYVTYNGNTNAFCFTIPPCDCTVVKSAEIIQLEGGVRQVVFEFDIDAETFCPFIIHLSQTGGGSGAEYPVWIYSLSDLTFVGGMTYTKTVTIYPWNTSVTYQTFKLHVGLPYDTEPCMGEPQTVFYECISPEAAIEDISIITDFDSGNTYLRIGFNGNCNDYTCNEFSLNYQQLVGGTDSGTYTFTADCSSYPSTTYMNFLLSPSAHAKTYRITLIGCCGMIHSNKTISCKQIPNADISYEVLLLASQYVLRVTINSCGSTCKNFKVYRVQSHFSGGTGAQDVGYSSTITPDCDAAFPQSFDIPITPNLGEPTIRYGVQLDFRPCCGTSTYTFVTYTP